MVIIISVSIINLNNNVNYIFLFNLFFSNIQQGFPFHSGGLGVKGAFARRCVRERNRPQPFATVRVRTVWPCLWEVLQRWSFLEVSDVWLPRFAWQVWYFVTFRRVLQCIANRFAWQAQYFCDVFRRCIAVFVGRRNLDASIGIFRGRCKILDVLAQHFRRRGGYFLEVSDLSLLCFVWQVWHFVTFRWHNTFVIFSEDILQFSWQAHHFGRVHRYFSWQVRRFRRVLLRVFL